MHFEAGHKAALAEVVPLRTRNDPGSDVPLRLRGLTPQERVEELIRRGIIGADSRVIRFDDEDVAWADGAIENVIGFHGTPLGAIVIRMNGLWYYVPMAIEETSVIGAAAKGAKMCLATGGVRVTASERPTTRVQIMYAGVKDVRSLRHFMGDRLLDIEAIVNEECSTMAKYGASPAIVGAAYELHGRGRRPKLVLPIEIDTCDAMGANVVTRIGEKLSSFLQDRYGLPRRRAAIVSNEGSGFTVEATAYWEVPTMERLLETLDVAEWAEDDPSRAATHNKGAMNGIDAVALGTGQDWRAIGACAHTGAIRNGHYGSLSTFRKAHKKLPFIRGTLSMKIPCGTVGGATNGPFAAENLIMANVSGARELAMLMAAVGLVQNFAAIYSLSGEGIPAAHERLTHRR